LNVMFVKIADVVICLTII